MQNYIGTKLRSVFLKRGQSVSEQDKTHILEALSDKLQWIKQFGTW